jgi:MoaA/NifB/PqqE/SkfB family radical SAM enzyme
MNMGMSKRNVGELTPGREIVQVFRAAGGQLTFISPIVATFARQNSGAIRLSLHRMKQGYAPPRASGTPAGPPGWGHRLARKLRARNLLPPPEIGLGEQLAALQLPCGALFDGESLDFPVGPLVTMRGEFFALRIRAEGTRPGAAPTVWVTEDETRIPGHAACYVDGRPQQKFGLVAQTTYGGVIAETSVPEMLLYSPVTQCNLNCIHCISAHTRVSVNRLSPSVKDDMRAWAASGALKIISSDYSGDLLWADQRFGGELDFISSLGIPFHIDTNGVCLTREVAERLCRENIASLNISLDAAWEATYKRVRKGAPPLPDVVANIEGFMRIRAAAGIDCPVSISFTLMRSTLAEWPDFLRLGARLGVDIVISRHLEAFTPEMENDSLWHDREAFNAAREEIIGLAEALGIEVTIPPPFAGTPRAGRRLCNVPWTSAVILGNGDVAACCVPGLVMGNLNKASMPEIWNGKSYRELRATVNSDNPLPVCAACPMFRHTDNPDSYLIHSATQLSHA